MVLVQYSPLSAEELNFQVSKGFATYQDPNIVFTSGQADGWLGGTGPKIWRHTLLSTDYFADLEPYRALPTPTGLMQNLKVLRPLPIISSVRCPATSLLEGGGTIGLVVSSENEIAYDLVWALWGKEAANNFEQSKELGHEPTEDDRFAAMGGT
jgi:hypothetical protein